MRIDKNFTSPLMPLKKLPRIRFLFWVILCALSVFFTEVVSGRTPSIFFNIYGLLVTTPLYLLQLMVLVPLVFRYGRPKGGTLYLAGVLFALYEAYITKMIWSPADYPVDVYAGGVAVFSTLMLVLFWHPLMSWVLPLFTADGLLNAARTMKIRLPNKWLSRLANPIVVFTVLGGILGLIHGAMVAEPAPALFSAVSSTLIIWILLILWKRLTGGNVFNLSQLMPDRKQWKIYVFLLAADYAALGFAIRPDAFPPLAGHLMVIAMYLVIGGLLLLSLRADKKEALPVEETAGDSFEFRISTKNWLVFSGGFTALSFIASMLQEWSRDGIHYIVWGLGIALGILLFVFTIIRLFKRLDLRIKLPQIRGFAVPAKTRMSPAEQFNYAKTLRHAQIRRIKIHFDPRAFFKKAVSAIKTGFHQSHK